MSIKFSFKDFLVGHQNSKSLKYWANDEPGFIKKPYDNISHLT